MNSSQRYYILLFVALGVYFAVSKYIFDKINDTINIFIDELFHMPQAKAYCEGNYTQWDPKITTLPGLYIISSLVLTSLDCSTYNLRLVNLIASCLNIFLFGSILKYVYFIENRQLKIVLQAVNLALLPPLYFFSHVFYTETLSLTFLLAFSRLCFSNQNKVLALLFGFGSVLMRQTNIAWIAMVLGHKLLDILIKSSRVFGNTYLTNVKLSKTSLIARDLDNSKLRRYYGLNDVYIALKYHISKGFVTVFKFLTLQDWLVIISHSILLISFVAFLMVNGSIVLGDKTAHEVTIHLPQLLYFLLFYGVFGFPYVLFKLQSTVTMLLRNKLIVVSLAIIMAAVVHFDTVVHPYLLADNRHFTFYIWNRWFGKYNFAIYATIPAYIFLLFSLYDNLKDHNCISFLLPYTIILFSTLGLQKLIEIRYFLLPYIILRLRFVRASFSIVLFEFLWYVGLNAAAFYIFFDKEVVWTDFDEVQRIIW